MRKSDGSSLQGDVTTSRQTRGEASISNLCLGINKRVTSDRSNPRIVLVYTVKFRLYITIVGIMSQCQPSCQCQLVYPTLTELSPSTNPSSAYTASKHALQAFCDSLRAEVAGRGVTVTVVSPSYIRTQLSRNAVTATGDPYDSELAGSSHLPARGQGR